jgi:hypothetical protein
MRTINLKITDEQAERKDKITYETKGKIRWADIIQYGIDAAAKKAVKK